jgi:hypothetical protein
MAAPVTLLDTSALAPQEREGAIQGFKERFTQLDALEHACPPESIVTCRPAFSFRQPDPIAARWRRMTPETKVRVRDDSGSAAR